MSIWITGDIHGSPKRLSVDSFPEQKEMSKENDYVIMLGDFGLVWDYKGESKTEKYWLNWLEDKPITILFVDGNHENFDRLDSYPTEEWCGGEVHKIRPHIIHLMRGQVFNIDDCSIFTSGGASSHDISDGILELNDPEFSKKRKVLDKNPVAMYRVNHVSWWAKELPNEAEMQKGLGNLKKQKNKVDYIITHCAPASTVALIGHGTYEQDKLTRYLENIKQSVDYKKHFFGHYHINRQINDKEICLYEQITQIW